jgi:VWFA-related protein
MLPLLAESLNSAPHHETIILAAFAGHDHGLAGANWYLKQLTDEQRAQIRGMIQVEKVGRTTAAYAFPGPDASHIVSMGRRQAVMQGGPEPTTLSKVLPIAAHSLKYPDEPKQINDVPATEARVFDEANIQSIVIHSASYATITPPGKVEQVRLMRTALDPQIYTDTYNLLCVYALYLDKVYSLARSKAVAAQTAQAAPASQNGSPAASASQAGAAAPAASATLAANPAPPLVPASESRLPQPTPAAEGAQTNPVFRATTRLVQVDVVVTDKQGRPIAGLKQSDFTVLQDGKPQKVHVFEPHTGTPVEPNASATAASTPKLPPNTYSNHPDSSTSDSWTIVLFDLLNTPTVNQEYARSQLMKMLQTAPMGKPVALYMLTNRLVMVQGFTDESDKLLKAAATMMPGTSHVLTTEAQRQHEEGLTSYIAAEATESAPSSPDNAMLAQMTQGKMQQLRDMESFQIGDRAAYTLAAFESLSRAVSGYPGRKNLIWLSSAFPIQIMADPNQDWRPADQVAHRGLSGGCARIAGPRRGHQHQRTGSECLRIRSKFQRLWQSAVDPGSGLQRRARHHEDSC